MLDNDGTQWEWEGDFFPERRQWPFKSMGIGEVKTIEEDETGERIKKARCALYSHGRSSGKKFRARKKDGILYVKRVK
jgi:hypothetical protein